MTATELAIIGVALGFMLLFTVLGIWLTEKTLAGEDHEESNGHAS